MNSDRDGIFIPQCIPVETTLAAPKDNTTLEIIQLRPEHAWANLSQSHRRASRSAEVVNDRTLKYVTPSASFRVSCGISIPVKRRAGRGCILTSLRSKANAEYRALPKPRRAYARRIAQVRARPLYMCRSKRRPLLQRILRTGCITGARTRLLSMRTRTYLPEPDSSGAC